MCTCDHCSKLTMWKWSLNLTVGRCSPLDYNYSKWYEHELKVITSTIQYSQGPWYSTVQVQCIIIMSSIPLKHLHTHTRRERAKRAHSLYTYINKKMSFVPVTFSYMYLTLSDVSCTPLLHELKAVPATLPGGPSKVVALCTQCFSSGHMQPSSRS